MCLNDFHSSPRNYSDQANLLPSFASHLITSRGFPEYVLSKKGNFSFLKVLYGLLLAPPWMSLL